MDRAALAEQLAHVVEVEGPVHADGSRAAHFLNAAGIQRFGARIQQAFDEAVRLGVGRGLFLQRGEFLWNPQMQQPRQCVDRCELPAASRKVEFVAPEEIRRATLMVVEESKVRDRARRRCRARSARCWALRG